MTDITTGINEAIAAVQALDAPEAPVEAPVEDVKEPETEGVAQTEEVSDNADQSDGVEAGAEATDDDKSDGEAAAVDPVEPPEWWDAADKATFQSLTADQQAVVKRQEEKREAVVQKAKAEAQEARKASSSEVAKAKELADRLAEAMTDERKAFDAYFADIDWETYVQQDMQAAQADWIKYQTGLEKFNKAETARAEAQKLHRETFMREEAAKLSEIAPDLVNNNDALRSVGEYIVKTAGVDVEVLQTLSAAEISIAHKAMLYDKMMAEASSKASATPPKTTQTKPVKVVPQGGNVKQGTSQQRHVQALQNSLAQTSDPRTAVELVKALGL